MATLVLGTANFGSRYGISSSEKLSSLEIDSILRWSVGRVKELDTSEDYPGSHQAIAKSSTSFKITTKLNLNNLRDTKLLPKHVSKIASELGKDNIDTLLVRPHITDSTLTIRALEELRILQSRQVVSEIGLSIYTTDELDFFAQTLSFPMTFQVPLNLLNRSFEKNINSNRNVHKQNRFYVRSIFLQGLLLMKRDAVPDRLKAGVGTIEALGRQLASLGVSLVEATFAYIKEQEWVNGIIVGVRSLEELKQNMENFNRARGFDWSFLDHLPIPPSEILDPRQW